jgi:hypothetical protein
MVNRLEDEQRQSNQDGKLAEISVSEAKFCEALESSGIPLDIIEELDLESVCIGGEDGNITTCYRRKGEAL